MKAYEIAIALSLVTLGCGASAKGLDSGITRAELSAEKAAQHDKLVAAGDAAWAQRADRAQLELAIHKWDQAVKLDDADWNSYYKLSRGTYLLADGWLSFEADTSEGKAKFLAMHERGFSYAERGLAAASKDFEKRILAGTNIEDAIKVVGRPHMPLAYWHASNLGKWANAKSFSTILANKDRIFSLVSRIYEVAPDYFYGAADRYLGLFYAVAPVFAGGDLLKSYEHFQASLQRAPNYLGTYVLIAEFYTPIQTAEKDADPAGFEANLRVVIDAKPCPDDASNSKAPCILKELEPEAAVEKRKAEALLKRKDDLF